MLHLIAFTDNIIEVTAHFSTVAAHIVLSLCSLYWFTVEIYFPLITGSVHCALYTVDFTLEQ